MKKTPCFPITELSANDFLQEEELCTSLRHLKIHKTLQVASSELCSSLKFLLPLVLRCIADKFFSCGRFPHKEDIVNSWFDQEYGEESDSRMIKEMNVVKEAGTPWNDDEVSFRGSLLNQLQLPDDDKFEFFYHGTNHSGAENIIAGIDLKIKMGNNLEFGRGFYVTNTLSVANEWAQPKSPNTAVLVFRVCRMQLRNDGNIFGRNLMNDDEKWKSLLEKSLSSDSDFPTWLKELDFIEGPVVHRIGDFESNPIPKNDSYQLCVRQQKCASLFDRSLCAVVYFSS